MQRSIWYVLFLNFLFGTKPALRKEIDEVTAKLGQTATLKCQIIGRPVPEIKWYKGGKEIKEGHKYAATSDGRNHTLTISTDQQEDEGLYTCKAVNESGECETITEAAVITEIPMTSFSPGYATVTRPKKPSVALAEKEVVRTTSPEKIRPRSPSLDSTEKADTTLDLSTKIDYMSRYESRKKALKTERKFEIVTQQPFTLDHAPRVTVRMRSHRVPIGQNTKFTLNVQYKPEAQIKWYHNGVQIEESRKYRMFNMSGVLSLQIIDCQEEDSGTYRVVCTNAKGEASDYATLDVAGGGFSAYASQLACHYISGEEKKNNSLFVFSLIAICQLYLNF
uniref:Ig-like domain-containing protein n=1 Tax=Cyprinus carpio TaxID=7962 RepID=A0A8C2F7Z7_CYPCA